MAVVFPTHVHSSWLGKIKGTLEIHRLKTFAVITASTLLGGTLGMIILLAALNTGDLRLIVMTFPHALASAVVFILFLAGIFSLTHYDP